MSSKSKRNRPRHKQEKPIKPYTLMFNKGLVLKPEERMETLLHIMVDAARSLKLRPSAILDVAVELTQRQIATLETALEKTQEEKKLIVPQSGISLDL